MHRVRVTCTPDHLLDKFSNTPPRPAYPLWGCEHKGVSEFIRKLIIYFSFSVHSVVDIMKRLRVCSVLPSGNAAVRTLRLCTWPARGWPKAPSQSSRVISQTRPLHHLSLEKFISVARLGITATTLPVETPPAVVCPDVLIAPAGRRGALYEYGPSAECAFAKYCSQFSQAAGDKLSEQKNIQQWNILGAPSYSTQSSQVYFFITLLYRGRHNTVIPYSPVTPRPSVY